MTLTLSLQPEIERNLIAQAHAKGVSPADYAQEVLEQEVLARQAIGSRTPAPRTLVELFAPIRGLFAEGELDFSRDQSPGRPLDLS